MYNPKDILTEDGYENYLHHIKNIENAIFYICNHADDLHIGSKNGDDSLDILWKIEEILPHLKKGDGEIDD